MAVPPPSYPAWVTRLSGPGRSGARRPPVKPPRPLVLADRVSSRRLQLGEATCVTEMSLMMACWKQNEFNDAVCAKEIQTFLDCAAKAEAERKEKITLESLNQLRNLDAKQVNKLLKRFPNHIRVY
ncbi:small ribosomal subunit protein mS37 [Tiliqua scincoides]|uniref:small ribosomal subunit protein mS37 n=1 Tax=Tiliqua scincoides TaxID=71010 RepID=UPI003461A727